MPFYPEEAGESALPWLNIPCQTSQARLRPAWEALFPSCVLRIPQSRLQALEASGPFLRQTWPPAPQLCHQGFPDFSLDLGSHPSPERLVTSATHRWAWTSSKRLSLRPSALLSVTLWANFCNLLSKEPVSAATTDSSPRLNSSPERRSLHTVSSLVLSCPQAAPVNPLSLPSKL